MVSFDVSSDVSFERDDDGVTGVAPEATGPADGWWSRAGARWQRAGRRQRRLVACAAGGVALVLVGGTAVGAAVVSHTQEQRLRAAPGGVVSLEGELAEVWRAPGSGVLAVLPDGGLVLAEGEDVVAVDAASGEERWRTGLGEELECGPQPRLVSGVEWGIPSDLVTCLHGLAAERTVTVLGASGDVVGQRDLPAAEYGGEDRDVAPAADGGLLVAEHDTGLPAVLDFATEAEAMEAVRAVEPGEASVRVEDAVTGDVRFEVPTGSPDGRLLDECFSVWDRSDGGFWPSTFDEATPFWIQVYPPRELTSSPAVVGYQWCDVGGASTVDGVPLGEQVGNSAYYAALASGSSILPVHGGGYVVPGDHEADGSALLDADGAVLLESSTLVVAAPTATVDADESVILATESYEALVGLDPDGEELWRTVQTDPRVLALVGGVAVISEGEELIVVDAQDGTERWWVAPGEQTDDLYTLPTSAVTDGERVTVALMVYRGEGEVAGDLLTVDLTTGTTTRHPLDTVGIPYVAAVDGHLLLQDVAVPDEPGDTGVDVTSVSVLAPR